MTREETVKELLTELIDMIDNGSQRDLDRADEIGISIIKLFEQEPCTDAVSRADFEAHLFENYCVPVSKIGKPNQYSSGCFYKDVVKCLDELPSVTQKPIECEDAVSRDAALEKMADYVASGYADSAEDFLGYSRIICQLPSVTRQTGEWILLDECANSGYYCSRCQKKLVKEGWSDTVKKIKFCPNCGARILSHRKVRKKND